MSEIPIQNIYYLLCYAWNKLEEKDVVDVHAEDVTRLADLFAKVLITGTTYLLKKGLDRDYRSTEETHRRIKGKLLLAPSIKQNVFHHGTACCQYDDLSHDILHNQILKSTISNLIKVRNLDKDLKKSLIALFRRFPPVSDIDVDAQHFRRIRLNRNNYFYDFVLKVCEIVNDGILIDERTGDYRFRDFVKDQSRMNMVFEAFVRNFYKKEQGQYWVSRENIDWRVEETGEHDHYLPGMATDISLEAKDKTRKIVIDTKFYSDGFKKKSWLGSGEKLISENLYQMFAYLKNLEGSGGANLSCEGVILYAAVGDDADLHFSLPGHKLRVKTLNLNQDWMGIHKNLLAMIE